MSFLSGCKVAHTLVSNLRDCSPHRLCRAWLQTICPLLWRLPSWLKGPQCVLPLTFYPSSCDFSLQMLRLWLSLETSRALPLVKTFLRQVSVQY